MTPPRRYARPPIIEAVFEFQFEEPSGERDLERLRDRFKRQYPAIEQQLQISVEVRGEKVTTTSTPSGFKMTSANALDVLLVQTKSLGTTRLAPYESWESLISTAKANYEAFTKIVGRRKITRIGARFLNRIDIPTKKLVGQSLIDWVYVGIAIPTTVTAVIGPYSLSVNCVDVQTGIKIQLQSSLGLTSLLEHASIFLDVDAYQDTDIPTRLDELWEHAEVLRQAKNNVFENNITDATRALFQ